MEQNYCECYIYDEIKFYKAFTITEEPEGVAKEAIAAVEAPGIERVFILQ